MSLFKPHLGRGTRESISKSTCIFIKLIMYSMERVAITYTSLLLYFNEFSAIVVSLLRFGNVTRSHSTLYLKKPKYPSI